MVKKEAVNTNVVRIDSNFDDTVDAIIHNKDLKFPVTSKKLFYEIAGFQLMKDWEKIGKEKDHTKQEQKIRKFKIILSLAIDKMQKKGLLAEHSRGQKRLKV